MSQRWLMGLWVALLGLIIYLANSNALPEFFEIVRQLPGGDKAGHFFLLGVASLLANLCLKASHWQLGRLRLLRGSVIVGTIITIEECTQIMSPHRSFSASDMFFNFAGIIVFGRLARWQVARATKESADLRSENGDYDD